MCGICGVWGATSADDAGSRMGAMLASVAHRGPDGEGHLSRFGVELGVRRLAVIDLGGGSQPVFNEAGTVGVVFDGEIYNFPELRTRLEADGHRFATRSDTEVLAHGYEQWGEDLPHELRGMFAFAIWDSRANRLLVVRDRFGKKPLYWARLDDEVVFASEIKALLQAGVPADLDDDALGAYLALRYVPAPRTLFRGIRQLEPGHLMVIDADGTRERRWWRLDYGPKTHMALPQAAERTEQLLRESVALRMRSDVPLGCFLSGDPDSSTMLSYAAELSDQPVSTFSVGFEEGWATDHLGHAQLASDAFGTRHHELRIGPTPFLDLLPQAVWHRDEPLADPMEIPLMALSRMAREHVTVVLSDLGSDEVFAGHAGYRAPLAGGRLGGGTRLLRRTPVGRMFGASRTLRPFDGAHEPEAGVNDRPEHLGRLDAMLARDLEGRLVDNRLIGVDKMTMAASVECRMPFLDHVLVEFVARLPEHLKATSLRTNVLARHIAAQRLPKALRGRSKADPIVPLASWFRGNLGDRAERMLLSDRARRRAFVPEAETRAALAVHRSGRHDLGLELWSLLTLEVWARIFLEGDDPADVVLG